jgi:hypothetical protein
MFVLVYSSLLTCLSMINASLVTEKALQNKLPTLRIRDKNNRKKNRSQPVEHIVRLGVDELATTRNA